MLSVSTKNIVYLPANVFALPVSEKALFPKVNTKHKREAFRLDEISLYSLSFYLEWILL